MRIVEVESMVFPVRRLSVADEEEASVLQEGEGTILIKMFGRNLSIIYGTSSCSPWSILFLVRRDVRSMPEVFKIWIYVMQRTKAKYISPGNALYIG